MMRSHWTLLVLAIGCTTKTETVEPLMTELDAGAAAGVTIGTGIGTGVVEVPIVLQNDLGIAIPGDGKAELRVSGTSAALESSSVYFDASGYGIARVATDGPERFEVGVNSTSAGVGGGSEGVGYAVSESFPRLQLDQGSVLPDAIYEADMVRSGTGGFAVANGSHILWVPAEPGGQTLPVADLPTDEPVRGMWSVQLDDDGVLDLLVWNSSTAFALRGRDEGGYTWGVAWQPKSGEVTGMSAVDLNGDRLVDLAIASSGEITGGVEVLDGDGAWGFTTSSVLDLNYPVWGVSAADDARDGRADLSVLSAVTGFIRRYTLAEEGWVGGTWPELSEYLATEGTVLWPSADLNDDDNPDLLLVGPTGSSQKLIFYLLGDDVTFYDLDYSEVNLSPSELTETNPTELAVLSSDGLYVLAYQGAAASPQYKQAKRSISDETGPIGAEDVDGDGVRDLAVFGEDARFFAGELTDGAWAPTSWGFRSYSADVSGPVVYRDLDGDGLMDLLSLADNDNTVLLKAWYFVTDDTGTRLKSGDDVTLTGTDAEGLSVCEEDGQLVAYAISSAGASYNLTRVSFDSDSGVLTEDAETVVSGSMVACGEFGVYTVAVAANSGTVLGYNYSGGAISSGTTLDSLGAIEAITTADTNADGQDEVVGCSEVGCSIAAGDLDADGLDEVVTGGNLITLQDGAATSTLEGEGAVTVMDFDGDGFDDIIALRTPTDIADTDASRRIYVLRGVDGGAAPARVYHATRELHPPLMFGDVTGDGVPELVAEGTDGALVHTYESTVE